MSECVYCKIERREEEMRRTVFFSRPVCMACFREWKEDPNGFIERMEKAGIKMRGNDVEKIDA